MYLVDGAEIAEKRRAYMNAADTHERWVEFERLLLTLHHAWQQEKRERELREGVDKLLLETQKELAALKRQIADKPKKQLPPDMQPAEIEPFVRRSGDEDQPAKE